MRNYGIVLSLMTGFVLVSGQRAMAQTEPASKLSVANTSAEAPSTRPVELRLLSPNGTVIGHVFVDLDGGKQINFVNFKRIKATQQSRGKTMVFRFEGRGTVKTTRDGVEVNVLQMDREDAIIEYTKPESKV